MIKKEFFSVVSFFGIFWRSRINQQSRCAMSLIWLCLFFFIVFFWIDVNKIINFVFTLVVLFWVFLCISRDCQYFFFNYLWRERVCFGTSITMNCHSFRPWNCKATSKWSLAILFSENLNPFQPFLCTDSNTFRTIELWQSDRLACIPCTCTTKLDSCDAMQMTQIPQTDAADFSNRIFDTFATCCWINSDDIITFYSQFVTSSFEITWQKKFCANIWMEW